MGVTCIDVFSVVVLILNNCPFFVVLLLSYFLAHDLFILSISCLDLADPFLEVRRKRDKKREVSVMIKL